ncbi:hypothetical protein REPUB_Repub02eG0188000 [Reevesia pubescens]
MGNEGDSVTDYLTFCLIFMKMRAQSFPSIFLGENLFGAGTDTSSTTMRWGLAELINNPTVMEKARKEIDSVVGKNRILEESDIANLPYLRLQAVVKETLRLHPTGPFIVRESTKACVIAGYEIPADTRLYVNVWSLGRNSKQWRNHLEFRPERFLNSEEWQGKSQCLDVMGQDFNLLPFGSGRRSCPGAALALSIVSTVLGCIIQCFDWKLANDRSGTVDMEERNGMTLLRANHLVCFPVARLCPFPSI